MENKTITVFPSIRRLFSDSWNLFVSRLGRLFLFMFVSCFFSGIAFVVGFIIALFIFFISNISSALMTGHAASVSSGTVISVFGVIFVIIILWTIIIGAISSAWTILSLYEPKTTSFGTIFSKGFQLIIPLFVLGLLNFVFAIGGFFFFLIPAAIFMYLFLFVAYEVVCDGQRGIAAFKRSYAITTHNFGEIFVRLILIIVINVVLSVVAQLIIRQVHSFAFIWVLISFLISWYQLAYFFTLYQQAKAHTNVNRPVPFVWIWIITAIGWIFFLLIFTTLLITASQFIASGGLAKLEAAYASKGKVTPTPTPVMTTPTAQQQAQQMMDQYNQNVQNQGQQPTP